MPWDPMNVWPGARRWLWVALAVLVCALQGPSFVSDLRPPQDRGLDFFQDWASARNRLEGLPIYTRHDVTAERYLGLRIDTTAPYYVPVNAHPPASVLFVMPLAWLDYPEAFLAWTLLSLASLLFSLWLVGRELGISFSLWSVFPVVTLLLICDPFRAHIGQGQLGIVLLGLIAGSWVAYRRGWPVLGGALLAAATAIKLFPGFLYFYFLLRREWRVLVGGAVSFVLLTALTAGVLGTDIYTSYFKEVLPQATPFQSSWMNASLAGIWFKLFDPLAERMQIEPLWRSPALARGGALLSSASIVAILGWLTLRARSRTEEDGAFGLAVIAMLLVSPLTWEHYFPMLLIPLALIWVRLPPAGASAQHWLFAALVATLWLCTEQLIGLFLPGLYLKNVAAPLHTVTLLSFKCYALLALFAFGALNGERRCNSGGEDARGENKNTASVCVRL